MFKTDSDWFTVYTILYPTGWLNVSNDNFFLIMQYYSSEKINKIVKNLPSSTKWRLNIYFEFIVLD